MGWSYGHNAEGREVGYSVDAVCDEEGCDAKIDRGVANCCGGMHDGGDHGCGGYFCSDHLWLSAPQRTCLPCAGEYEVAHRDEGDG